MNYHMTSATATILFGDFIEGDGGDYDNHPPPIGVGGFSARTRRAVPGVGDIPTFPPQTPSVYLQDADDLQERIVLASQKVLLSTTKVPLPDFPYGAWSNFQERWSAYYNALKASVFRQMATTPDEQNAYWQEFRGFLPLLNAIGYVDIAPKDPPSDLGGSIKEIAVLALVVLLAISFGPVLLSRAL